jgi:DNA-binding winged helix-turn-helix (wHTH) protein
MASWQTGGGVAYRIGEFTLNEDTRQLLANAGEVHLSPKAFDLLALLVANRDRAVSKRELQQRLWPSTFVEETNLASLVAEIRRALSDSAAAPRFVRTVYGFGYRFVGEPRVVTAADGTRATLWLIIEGRQIPLPNGVSVIGRAADAAVRVDAPGMSRYHARIRVENGQATLEDLASKNGTHLNGRRLSAPEPLQDGHQIRVGGITLTFRIVSPGSPTDTLLPPVEDSGGAGQ